MSMLYSANHEFVFIYAHKYFSLSQTAHFPDAHSQMITKVRAMKVHLQTIISHFNSIPTNSLTSPRGSSEMLLVANAGRL